MADPTLAWVGSLDDALRRWLLVRGADPPIPVDVETADMRYAFSVANAVIAKDGSLLPHGCLLQPVFQHRRIVAGYAILLHDYAQVLHPEHPPDASRNTPPLTESRFVLDLDNPSEYIVATKLPDDSLLVSVDYIMPSCGFIGSHLSYCAPPVSDNFMGEILLQVQYARHCPVCLAAPTPCVCDIDLRLSRWSVNEVVGSTRPSTWADVYERLSASPAVTVFRADLKIINARGEVVHTKSNLEGSITTGRNCASFVEMNALLVTLLERHAQVREQQQLTAPVEATGPMEAAVAAGAAVAASANATRGRARSGPRPRGRSMTCEHCGLVFSRKDNCTRHIREVHLGNARRPPRAAEDHAETPTDRQNGASGASTE